MCVCVLLCYSSWSFDTKIPNLKSAKKKVLQLHLSRHQKSANQRWHKQLPKVLHWSKTRCQCQQTNRFTTWKSVTSLSLIVQSNIIIRHRRIIQYTAHFMSIQSNTLAHWTSFSTHVFGCPLVHCSSNSWTSNLRRSGPTAAVKVRSNIPS